MKKETLNRMLRMQEITKKDDLYQQMLSDFKETDPKLLALLEEVSQEQKHIILDYLGTFGAMHLRMVELACQRMVFADELE